MMRKLLAIFLIALSQMAYGEEDGRVKFTESEVRINTERFINTIFGEKSPTLADKLKFDGGYESLENDETPLLYELCKHKYKISNPVDSQECFDTIITPRLNNPSRYTSLYYKQIRKKLGVSASQLRFKSIRWVDGMPGQYSGAFLVTVDIDDGKRHPYISPQLILIHVPYHDDVVDSGTVKLYQVALPIHEYLQMPK